MVMDSTLERCLMMTLHPHPPFRDSPLNTFLIASNSIFPSLSVLSWFYFFYHHQQLFFFFKSLLSPVYIVDLVHCVQGFQSSRWQLRWVNRLYCLRQAFSFHIYLGFLLICIYFRYSKGIGSLIICLLQRISLATSVIIY